MTGFQLKLLACFFMLIDHIGAILYPNLTLLRIVGRIAFPLFAFLLTEGYRYTHNIKKYALRLFIGAIIMQIPCWLGYFKYCMNIFFTLFLGLIALIIFKRFKDKPIMFFGLLSVILIISEILDIDYGAYGVLYILFFYAFKIDIRGFFLFAILQGLYVIQGSLAQYINSGKIGLVNTIQIWSLGSLILILFYNGRKGRGLKYFFYIFYPVHQIILYVIKDLM